VTSHRPFRTECGLCRAPLSDPPLAAFADMPALAQHFPSEKELSGDGRVDFNVLECAACGLVQVDSAPVYYFRDVIRASAYSPAMRDFRLKQFAQWIDAYGLSGKRILEVGCGRGEFLELLRLSGVEAIGLEHNADSAEHGRGTGLPIVCGYPSAAGESLAGAPYDGFISLSFLEHAADLRDFLLGVRRALAPGAIGLVEVPNFDMIYRSGLSAEFMTDHLWYFSESTLRRTLEFSGFDVLECSVIWHDYIISAVVHARVGLSAAGFAETRDRLAGDLERFFSETRRGKAAVWGAGHQALAVIAMYGLERYVQCVVDSAPFKQGKFTPGTHLPVLSPNTLKTDQTLTSVLVAVGSYSDEVVKTLLNEYPPHLQIGILKSNRVERVIR
jgi:SAM-dependent methyltransferase